MLTRERIRWMVAIPPLAGFVAAVFWGGYHFSKLEDRLNGLERDGAVAAKEVKLLNEKVRDLRGPAGPEGPMGPQGPSGDSTVGSKVDDMMRRLEKLEQQNASGAESTAQRFAALETALAAIPASSADISNPRISAPAVVPARNGVSGRNDIRIALDHCGTGGWNGSTGIGCRLLVTSLGNESTEVCLGAKSKIVAASGQVDQGLQKKLGDFSTWNGGACMNVDPGLTVVGYLWANDISRERSGDSLQLVQASCGGSCVFEARNITLKSKLTL